MHVQLLTFCSPNDYKDDGQGINYALKRNLATDVAKFKAGAITRAELDDLAQYKFGESSDFSRRRRDYRRCEGRYVFEWEATYTTPERKLTGASVYSLVCTWSN